MAMLSSGNLPSGARAGSDWTIWMSIAFFVCVGGVSYIQMLGQLYTVIGLKQLANISNY